MTKFVTFPSDTRITSFLCSSLTVLLTACGGGGGPAAQGNQTADLIAVDTAAPAQTADEIAAAALALANAHANFAVEQERHRSRPPSDGGTGPGDPEPPPDDPDTPPEDPGTPGIKIPDTTYNLYVSPDGDDDNPGTAREPFRTLARAARATRPSTTVFVAPGSYAGGLKTTVNGSADGRIYYVSTTKWGARIVPSGPAKVAWDNRGNYVDIIGFHIDGSGSSWTGGIYNGGSYDVIRGNWVHHIAKGVSCTSGGGSAIGVDSYYHGVKSDVIGNLVHDIGPAGCRYVQGIYISTSGTVKNNVVYRVAEGAIHLWHDANNVIITNNTVANSNTGIIVGGGDYYHTSGPSDHNRVYNNIVYDNKMGISEQGKTGRNNKYGNNLVFQNSTYDFRLFNSTPHTATVTSAPLFMSYTKSGTPDLRLSSSSPAIGRGTRADAPSYDFLERPRDSSSVDIGAYQH